MPDLPVGSLPPNAYSFTRYLAAKKSVDDRALNHHVWQKLAELMSSRPGSSPPRILEVGSGIGTMLERMLDWGLFAQARYVGLDAEPANTAAALERIPEWADRGGYGWIKTGPSQLSLEKEGLSVRAVFETLDLYDFLNQEDGSDWDLLIAHAFLDLVDIPSTLPRLLSLLDQGGLFYFTLNFDGLTLLEPPIDPELDELIQLLYHRSMDERRVAGKPSGDSRTGRRLFAHLEANGAEVLEAGASDWVVIPRAGSYPHDEAYFLHFIIHTIHTTLENHPALDRNKLTAWAAERHAQIELGELIYIAHQLDFVGRMRRA